MKRIIALSSCLAALTLGACGHKEVTQFYTLAATDAASPAPAEALQPVTIGSVNLPSILDRLQIVRRAGENQIVIADEQRWASPLDEMTRRTLQEDLEHSLPAQTLRVGEAAANDPTIGLITVEVDKFESDTAGHVEFDAHWTVTKGDPARTLVQSAAQISETANNAGYPAMADAMSHAVADLAARIAATLPRK